jgi:hypothetical protein
MFSYFSFHYTYIGFNTLSFGGRQAHFRKRSDPPHQQLKEKPKPRTARHGVKALASLFNIILYASVVL